MNEILNLINPWWFKKSFETGIERPKYKKRLLAALKHNRVVFLVGPRRVGKTTLFYQIIKDLLTRVNSHHIFYSLMDHPQLSMYKIYDLVEEFRSQYSLDRKTKIYLFLDEIQYLKDWEQEIKALSDTENIKIFLSGSASSQILLKGTYLTGRMEKLEVFPLDFSEFLMFKRAKIDPTETYKFEKLTDDYLKIGGYPEYVLKMDPAYFSDLINNILYKDIVSMYQLRNPDLLKDLFLLIGDRTGHITTYSKLASILSLKTDTVKEYMYYLKNTFLISELERISESRAARIYGPKKFYINDNGVLYHILGKLSHGAAFEQTLFHYLRTRTKVGFYYESQKEVDFLIENEGKLEMWESKYNLDKSFDLKIPSYLKIAKSKRISTIRFINRSEDKEMNIDSIKFIFMPLWKILTKG